MKDHERDALFASARSAATPTDDDRRRVRVALSRKLGVVAGASVGVTAAKAAASVTTTVVGASNTAGATTALAGFSGIAMVKVTAIVIALAAVGVVALPRRVTAPTSKSVATTALSSAPIEPSFGDRSSPPPRALPIRDPSIVASATEPPARPREAVRSLSARALPAQIAVEPPTAAVPVPLPSSSEATDDIALVKQMQAALRSNDLARVLALVHEHEQRFPASVLAPERDGARVLATCPGATPAEAARIGETFLEAHPRSPLAVHVRLTCGVR